MPKSAPRRKRIRTARAEAAPTSIPDSRTTVAGVHQNAIVATTSTAAISKASKKAAKKQAGGQDQQRDKQLGPVIQKVHSLSLAVS